MPLAKHLEEGLWSPYTQATILGLPGGGGAWSWVHGPSSCYQGPHGFSGIRIVTK